MAATMKDAITVLQGLSDERQDELAEVILTLASDANATIADHHREEIARRFAEPFEAPDPVEVEDFFARHGAWAGRPFEEGVR